MKVLFSSDPLPFSNFALCHATSESETKEKPDLIGHPISVHGQDTVCGSAFFRNYMIVGEIAYRSGWDDTK